MKIAVIIPRYRNLLTEGEEKSLSFADKYLCSYEKINVSPEGLALNTKYPSVTFPPEYFEGISGYNSLMLSKVFYRAFKGYDYILIYHLDSLVFSSDLIRFCNLDFDYIGAPWVESADGQPTGFGGVGNGGLSLRKVEACLQVLESRKSFMTPLEYWNKIGKNRRALAWPISLVGAASKFMLYRNDVDWFLCNYLNNHKGRWYPNEDLFWSRWSGCFSEFSVAPLEVALEFCFEKHPRYCYGINKNKMPFGCHGWERYDPEFWREMGV